MFFPKTFLLGIENDHKVIHVMPGFCPQELEAPGEASSGSALAVGKRVLLNITVQPRGQAQDVAMSLTCASAFLQMTLPGFSF